MSLQVSASVVPKFKVEDRKVTIWWTKQTDASHVVAHIGAMASPELKPDPGYYVFHNVPYGERNAYLQVYNEGWDGYEQTDPEPTRSSVITIPMHKPTMEIEAPSNNVIIMDSTPVVFRTKARDIGGTIREIRYYLDGNLVNTITYDPSKALSEVVTSHNYRILSIWPGKEGYTLSAEAVDNYGATADRTSVFVRPHKTPTLTVSSPTSYNDNQEVKLTASGVDADGTVDHLHFYLNGTKVKTLNQASGTHSFGYLEPGNYRILAKAEDNHGHISTQKYVDISVANTRPTLSFISNKTIAEDNPLSVNFNVGDFRTAANALDITVTSDKTSILNVNNESIVGTGNSRTIVATPVLDANGVANLTVTVTDADGAKTSQTFAVNVTPVNDKPVIAGGLAKPFATIGEAYSTKFSANDVDSSNLTYSIDNTTKPSWLSFSPETGVLSGTPSEKAIHRNIQVSVSDGEYTVPFKTLDLQVTKPGELTESQEDSIYKQYIVYEDSAGNIYLELPKQFVLIAGDITVPIYFRPKNGLLKLSYVNGSWQAVELNESQFASLTLQSSNYTVTFTGTLSESGAQLVLYSNTAEDDLVLELGGANASNSLVISTLDELAPAYARMGGTVADVQLDSTVPEASTFFGAIPGRAGVNGGAASYSIPIQVAPGRAGMQPNVSLNYSSQSGNGVAGVGWSLSAYSSISRCAPGLEDQVKMSNSDKLCYNGQELKVVEGTYGQVNAVYRTEIDNFEKVTQLGGLLNTNDVYFKVETNSGVVSMYGNDAGSTKKLGGHNSAVSWLLNTSANVGGKNVIDYDYVNYSNGEVLISKITYTCDGGCSNDDKGYTYVEFNYEDRTDLSSSYLYGGRSRTTKRLDSITAYAQSSKVKTYTLNYETSAATNRTILRSLDACVGTGVEEVCQTPTEFNWHDSATHYQVELLKDDNDNPLFSGPKGKLQDIAPSGDKNGDGARDWPGEDTNGNGLRDEKGFYINAEGRVTDSPYRYNNCSRNRFTFNLVCLDADFDLDGKTDNWSVVNGKLTISYANDPTAPVTTQIELSNLRNGDYFVSAVDDTLYQVDDYNNDGWPDILVYYGGSQNTSVELHFHSKNPNDPYASTPHQTVFTLSESIRGCSGGNTISCDKEHYAIAPVGDLDGDGIPDFAASFSGTPNRPAHPATRYIYFSNYDKDAHRLTFTHVSSFDNSYVSSDYKFSMFMDVNADGLPDWIGWHNTSAAEESTELYLMLNKGNRTFAEAQALGVDLASRTIILSGTHLDEDLHEGTVAKFQDALLVMDVNGDGRNELLTPLRIHVGACHTIGAAIGTNRFCGDSVYDNYKVKVDDKEHEISPIAAHDHNIYQYAAISFNEAADGSFSASQADTNLYGNRNKSVVVDGFGKGLPDLVTSYGCAGSYCTMQPAPANGPFAGLDPGIYFNRNYGATTETSPGANDYRARDLLQSVDNGVGIVSEWNLRPLTSKQPGENFYERDDDSFGCYIREGESYRCYGYLNFASSMYVVSEFSQTNGLGGNNSKKYQYKGAGYHKYGRGFVGFSQITELDETTGLVTTNKYKTRFPYIGRLESKTICEADETPSIDDGACDNSSDKLVSELLNTWYINTSHNDEFGGFGIRNPILLKTTSNLYDLGAETLYSSTTTLNHQAELDIYNNAGKVTTTVVETDLHGDGTEDTYTTVKEATFDTTNVAEVWWPHKMTGQSTTTSVEVDSSGLQPKTDAVTDKVISVDYSAHDDDLRVAKTVITCSDVALDACKASLVPAEGSVKLTKSTEYNDYGLPDTVSTTGRVYDENGNVDNVTRIVKTKYSKNGETESADGHFIYKVESGGLTTTTKTNVKFGLPIQVKDPSSVITSTEYDDFGRVASTQTSGMPATYIRHHLENTVTNAKSKVQVTQAGQPASEEIFDALGRVVRKQHESFDVETDGWIKQDTLYNARGLVAKQSSPYFGTDVIWREEFTDYDARGRLKSKVTSQTNGTLSTTYNYVGHKTDIEVVASTASATGLETLNMSRVYNSRKQLISTTDAKKGVTRYAYDGAGNPIAIEDASDNVIYATYNSMGQKQWVEDPNQGKTTYKYNDFGELAQERHTDGNLIRYGVDSLGRVDARRDNGVKATFNWDVVPGKLHSESQHGIDKEYEYDIHGRVTKTHVTIDGETYSTETLYDANLGRVKGMVYPNNLTLAYDYNENGYLTTERNAVSHYVYKHITAQDAFNNVTNASIASSNGSDFIYTGTYAFNSTTGQMERNTVANSYANVQDIQYSGYDSYGNLTEQKNLVSGMEATESYVYDALHRLDHNSMQFEGYNPYVVDYEYDAIGNLTKKSDYATSYDYTGSSNSSGGPNAVKKVTLLNGNDVSFDYDSRGNLTHRDGSLETVYNAHNKPLSINRLGSTSSFIYGADQSRYKQVRVENGKTYTTYYIGKHYEVEQISGLAKRVTRAYLGDHSIVRYTQDSGYEIRFTHRDRLGSATTLTDEKGAAFEYRSFDPFGKPKNGDWRLLLAPGGVGFESKLANNQFSWNNDEFYGLFSNKGFTDHEHLDNVQLIHMNGRVYDYNLGRFMSVDPFIQEPGNSQSINPYSYIMNNPLAGTDPTGYYACAASAIKQKCENTSSRHGGYAESHNATVEKQNKMLSVTSAGAAAAVENRLAGGGASSANNNKITDIGSLNQISQSDFDKDNINGSGERAANMTTAGILPQGGSTAFPNLNDLASGLGNEIASGLKKGAILYALMPGQLGDSTLAAAISRGDIDENEQYLYHYTNSKENLDSIIKTQSLRASFGEKNARYGPGQYFTDVSPSMIAAETVAGLTKTDIALGNMSKGQAAIKLFGDARKKASLNYYIRINVTGLPIQNPRPNVYYLPNNKSLDLRGRVKGYGATLELDW